MQQIDCDKSLYLSAAHSGANRPKSICYKGSIWPTMFLVEIILKKCLCPVIFLDKNALQICRITIYQLFSINLSMAGRRKPLMNSNESDWDIPFCYSQGHVFFISSAFPWQEVNPGQRGHLKQHYGKWAFCKMWHNYTVIRTNSVFLL